MFSSRSKTTFIIKNFSTVRQNVGNTSVYQNIEIGKVQCECLQKSQDTPKAIGNVTIENRLRHNRNKSSGEYDYKMFN